MVDRILKRAAEGREAIKTLETMGRFESLILLVCPGLLIFGALIS